MKVIIAGSRDLNTLDVKLFLDAGESRCKDLLSKATEIVSGGARGVDKAGELYAHANNIPLKVFHADWEGEGKAAGPKRNKRMGEYADAAIVIMKRGGSNGSNNMIEIMNKLGKKVLVYEEDGA